jgi:hypothetical protein
MYDLPVMPLLVGSQGNAKPIRSGRTTMCELALKEGARRLGRLLTEITSPFMMITCIDKRCGAGSLRHLGVFEAWQSANCLFVCTLQHNLVIPANELGDWDRDEACGNTEKAPNA